MDGEQARLGMIHGRFQPFHNGHLEYLRGAAARSTRLLVGITNPDRGATCFELADPARHTAAANPFSYTERAEMVQAVLRDEGHEDALVVPFPISKPDLWADYIPAGTVHFIRVFDTWGEQKVARLRAAQQLVVVLDEGAPKGISGTIVRERLFGRRDWEALVPAPVAALLHPLLASHAPALRRPA